MSVRNILQNNYNDLFARNMTLSGTITADRLVVNDPIVNNNLEVTGNLTVDGNLNIAGNSITPNLTIPTKLTMPINSEMDIHSNPINYRAETITNYENGSTVDFLQGSNININGIATILGQGGFNVEDNGQLNLENGSNTTFETGCNVVYPATADLQMQLQYVFNNIAVNLGREVPVRLVRVGQVVFATIPTFGYISGTNPGTIGAGYFQLPYNIPNYFSPIAGSQHAVTTTNDNNASSGFIFIDQANNRFRIYNNSGGVDPFFNGTNGLTQGLGNPVDGSINFFYFVQ